MLLLRGRSLSVELRQRRRIGRGWGRAWRDAAVFVDCCWAARSSLTRCCASAVSRSRSARRSSASTTSWRSSPSLLNRRRSVTTNSGFFSFSDVCHMTRVLDFKTRVKLEWSAARWRSVRRSAQRCRVLRIRAEGNPAPDVRLAAGKWDARRTGYFAYILVVGANLCTGLRRLALRPRNPAKVRCTLPRARMRSTISWPM